MHLLVHVVKDFFRSCNLSQLIDSPTRITEHSSSLIDLIFSNSTNISKSGSIFCGLSDHNLIYCCIKCQKIKLPPKTIKFRDFKDFNGTAFNSTSLMQIGLTFLIQWILIQQHIFLILTFYFLLINMPLSGNARLKVKHLLG